MERTRYLEPAVVADLDAKMAFVAGPRQVGKTTLARHVLRGWEAGAYLSWDNREDRREIRAARWPGGGRALVVLDELHKWRGWKGWLKGEFDRHRERLRFLVTGSARLDVYRRGGDSLQGRYHHHRLHPFSYAEVAGSTRTLPEPGQALELPARGDRDLVTALMEFGGFPEPFLAQSTRGLRRWQKERLDRFLREDVRDLEPLRDLSTFGLLADLLPERVGALLSLNALREDLEVSHRALTHWMGILEAMYHVFRVRPFAGPRARTLSKMPKAYMWDAAIVPDRAARFENLVASHLLKLCHFLEDTEGHALGLQYLRDRQGREVDFVVTVGRRPWFAVEVELSETRVEPALLHFKERLAIPHAYQVTLEGTRDFVEAGVRVVPAHQFLAGLV